MKKTPSCSRFARDLDTLMKIPQVIRFARGERFNKNTLSSRFVRGDRLIKILSLLASYLLLNPQNQIFENLTLTTYKVTYDEKSGVLFKKNPI